MIGFVNVAPPLNASLEEQQLNGAAGIAAAFPSDLNQMPMDTSV